MIRLGPKSPEEVERAFEEIMAIGLVNGIHRHTWTEQLVEEMIDEDTRELHLSARGRILRFGPVRRLSDLGEFSQRQDCEILVVWAGAADFG